MRKEQVFFLIYIVLLFVLWWGIVTHKMKHYTSDTRQTALQSENTRIAEQNETLKKYVLYLQTQAFRDKIIKDELGYKRRGEQVISITNEETHRTYAVVSENPIRPILYKESAPQDTMKNYEKWMYFLFEKDIRK